MERHVGKKEVDKEHGKTTVLIIGQAILSSIEYDLF